MSADPSGLTSTNGHRARIGGLVRPVAALVPPAAEAGFDGDLNLIDQVHQVLAARVNEEIDRRRKAGEVVTDQDERALAGRELEAVLAGVLRERATEGKGLVSAHQEAQIKRAVLAEMFGLGRLESLLANPEVENIDIVGNDPVALSYPDGTVGLVAPIVSTDEALLRLLQRIAARHSRTERSINAASPLLNCELPGGERLAATVEVSHRPQVSIRRHRLRQVTLDELHQRAMLSQAQLALLRAAMRADKNIVVCGRQKAGKTTLLRGLCWEIPRDERFATLETELELGLHRYPVRFPLVLALEARPGSCERFESGHPVGGIGLDQLVWQALRMHTSRLVVGEVRGPESIPMLDAMSTGGASSLSTLHVRGASQAVERLVSLCLGANNNWREPFANRLVAQAIDLIVHVRMVNTGARLDRFVDEIVSIELGEHGRPARSALFAPATDGSCAGRGVPTGVVPTDLADYEAVGFSRAWLHSYEDTGNTGGWHLPGPSAPAGGS